MRRYYDESTTICRMGAACVACSPLHGDLYTDHVKEQTVRDAELNPTTQAYLDELATATGITKVALLEMSVAVLYRQFFGLTPLSAAAGTLKSAAYVVETTDGQQPTQTLKERREALGLTRVALAQAAGISEGTVRRFESGSYRPELVSAVMIQKLAMGLRWSERQTALAVGAKQHQL